MMRKTGITIVSLFAAVSAGAQAAPDKYEIDKTHTHIIFFANHLGYSQTIGRIKEYEGYFTFDENEPEKSEVDVTLKPASVDTSVPALDETLRGEKFFNVAQFPTMRFKSTGVKVTDKAKKTGDVAGELTLLGVTKPVTLHVTYNKSGIHPYTNNYVSGFSAEARIKRSEFGMDKYLPDVGDEVVIHIEAEGVDPFRHPGKQDRKTSGAVR